METKLTVADDATIKQVADQCRVVAHLAKCLSEIHDDYAKIFASGDAGPVTISSIVGERTARLMETLGDILNGMDAVTEEDDWTAPIFEEAQRRWPLPEEPR